MRVLICGGGVIGASIAYFLSRRNIETIVIERTGLACAASGKSGGFLAFDWCDGTPLEPLAQHSFACTRGWPGRSVTSGIIARSPPTPGRWASANGVTLTPSIGCRQE
jgi:glycine/D-amino acid oxidase-like deaminating enzyme